VPTTSSSNRFSCVPVGELGHYCAPRGDAGRRFRPVVISAGGNELRYLSPLSTSIRVLLPSLTALILPSPNNS